MVDARRLDASSQHINPDQTCARRNLLRPMAKRSLVSAPPKAWPASCQPANQKGAEKSAKRMPPLASAEKVQN
jgi:hypothetical protein